MVRGGGINAKHGSRQFLLTASSNNNIIRRSIFWDGNATINVSTMGVDDSSDNLLEDLAIFGTGRKSLAPPFGNSYRNIYRRIWARWEGSIHAMGANRFAWSVVYNKTSTSHQTLFENIIATWSGESMPQNYCATNTDGNPSRDYARNNAAQCVANPTFTNFATNASEWVVGRDNPNFGLVQNIECWDRSGMSKPRPRSHRTKCRALAATMRRASRLRAASPGKMSCCSFTRAIAPSPGRLASILTVKARTTAPRISRR